MAFILDGEIRSAPMIAGEIGGPLQVAIDAQPIDAERLAELIRSRLR